MGKKRGPPGGKASSRKKIKAAGPPIPSREEQEDIDISEDDIDFVTKHARDLAFLNRLDDGDLPQAEGEAGKNVGGNTDDESDDCGGELKAYERRPRGQQEFKEEEREESIMQLPIKTPSGEVIYQKHGQHQSLPRTSAQDLAGEIEGIIVEEAMEEVLTPDANGMPSDEKEQDNTEQEEEQPENGSAGLLNTKLKLREGQSIEERRQELKDQMACSGNKVLRNPEENMSDLKPLLAMLHDGDLQIQYLAMLSLFAVFKDICPGYRIRLPTEKEKVVKVSKEIARLQAYEAFLLRCYQIYLKRLVKVQKGSDSSKNDISQRRIVFQCLGGLLSSLHHFNYSSDILQAVVPEMCSDDEDIRTCCCQAVAKAIEGDTEGKMALEAVQLVADLVKRRKCNCPPGVLEALSGLRFPNINLAKDEDPHAVSKKKMKKQKKGDGVEKSFQAAKATHDLEQKASLQSQTVEALFEIFFRVLKDCAKITRSSGARDNGGVTSEEIQEKSPMLYQSLKGLSQYAHVLSVEYFQDLLEVFRQLLATPALPLLERLCCLMTASDILQGEGEALNIDNKDFFQQLYWTLKHWWPKKLTEENAENSDDEEKEQGSTQEMETLLVQLVNQMICENKGRDHPMLAAFLKRIMSLGLHQSTAAQMGIEAISSRLLLRHHLLRGLLDGEGGAPAGGKGYNPQIDEPSEAFALSTTLWELILLSKHYHPHVSQGALDLASIPLEAGHSSGDIVSSILSAMDGPVAVACRYHASGGTFWPLPKPPRKLSKAEKKMVFSETKPFASLMTSADSCEEDLELVQIELSAKKLFREARMYLENRTLRKELAVIKAQVASFQEKLKC